MEKHLVSREWDPSQRKLVTARYSVTADQKNTKAIGGLNLFRSQNGWQNPCWHWVLRPGTLRFCVDGSKPQWTLADCSEYFLSGGLWFRFFPLHPRPQLKYISESQRAIGAVVCWKPGTAGKGNVVL